MIPFFKTLASKPAFSLVVISLILFGFIYWVHNNFNKITLGTNLNRSQKIWIWLRIAIGLLIVHWFYGKFTKNTEQLVDRYRKEKAEADAKQKTKQPL